jgi:hypothetical protein
VAALLLIASSCAAAQGQTPKSPAEGTSLSPLESPSPQGSSNALTITGATFHQGEVSVLYAPAALAASGGVAPYTWIISAGALPGGLALSSDGSVAGTPKAAGTFHFNLGVGDVGGSTGTVARSIVIVPAPKASLIPTCALHCTVGVGCVTVCGKFGVVGGGTPPYSYAFKGGYIPQGTKLSGLSLAGTFTAPANYWQFTVLVTDSLGATSAVSPTFFVFPHIALAGGSCIAWENCTVKLRYSVGAPVATPTAKATWTGVKTCGAAAPAICPAPPFKASVQGGFVTITLGPTTYPNNPSGTYKLTLTDANQCGSRIHCSASATLTVNLNYG